MANDQKNQNPQIEPHDEKPKSQDEVDLEEQMVVAERVMRENYEYPYSSYPGVEL
jgi:hypothetical protein